MNKYQLYTLGGALLAATSLSAAAQAGSVGTIVGTALSATPIKIANTTISPTAATANTQIIGSTLFANRAPAIVFNNFYDHGFTLHVNITISGTGGAVAPLFDQTSTPAVNYLLRDGAIGTISATANAATIDNSNTGTLAVSELGTNIFIDNLHITANSSITGFTQGTASIAGVILEGVHFTNLAGMSTVGGSINLAATVYSQSNQVVALETGTAGTVVTSVAPLISSVTPGTAATVAIGNLPTQFTQLSGANPGTLTLATISITGVGALATDLSTTVTADGAGGTAAASGTLNITVNSTVFTDPALTEVAVQGSAGAVVVETLANFASGTGTFSILPAAFTYSGASTSIVVAYSGTTAISAALAGTATIAFSVAGSSVVAPAGASGATTSVSRNGLNTQIDWANSGSGSGYTSYIRVHNLGAVASTAQIVLKKDTADGTPITTVGTYTTATVPAGGTIQVSVPAIENALSITPNSATSYTLLISSTFPGYVQHLSVNGQNGSLVDLDGFRNGGTAGSIP